MLKRLLLPAVLVLGLAVASGCRHHGPPLPEADFRKRVAEYSAERAKLASFTGEYDLTLAGTRPSGKSGRLTCSGVIISDGGRVRMRGEKALGMAKIFDLLLAEGKVKAHVNIGNEFYQGSLVPLFTKRGAGSFLTPKGELDLGAFLLPVPPIEGAGAPELAFGRREVTAIWRDAAGGRMLRRAIFAADTGELMSSETFDASGRETCSVEYDEFTQSNGLHPAGGFHLRMKEPAKLRIDMTFHDLQANSPVKAAAFVLEPPADAKVIDLDKEEPAAGSGATRKP